MSPGLSDDEIILEVEGYTFVSAIQFEQLLTGVAARKLNLDSIRIFAAAKLVHSDTFYTNQISPRGVRKGLRGARFWTAFATLYEWVPHLERKALDIGKPIMVSSAALRFIATKATKAEAVLLIIFFLKRLYKKGFARFKYSEVHAKSRLGKQAISKGLDFLHAYGFIIPEQKSKYTHWPNYNHGRKYFDGDMLWTRKSLKKKRQRIKPTESSMAVNDCQNIKPTEATENLDELLQGATSTTSVLQIKPVVSTNQTYGVIESNMPCIQIKPPSIQEPLTRTLQQEPLGRTHPSGVSLPAEPLQPVKVNFDRISVSMLADESVRARVFVRGCNESRWQLKHRSEFYSLCDELMKADVETVDLGLLQAQMMAPNYHHPPGGDCVS